MTREEDPHDWTTDDLCSWLRWRSAYATPEGSCPDCGSRGLIRSGTVVDEWRNSRHLEFVLAFCSDDNCGNWYPRLVEDVQCGDMI